MRAIESVIRRPILTEKSSRLRETGGRTAEDLEDDAEYRQKVFFEVAREANKIEIRRAVEDLFKVKVHDVRTMIVRGKDKRIGRFAGRRPNWKKAIVTLAEGQRIELFEAQSAAEG